MNKALKSNRNVELDVLRGIAVVAMIIFHFTFDLSYFGFIPTDTIFRPNWIMFQKLIAGTFIYISGVSLHLCHGSGIRWQLVKKRILLIGGAALAISITTIFTFGEFWIKFGILHCILVCSIISLVLVIRSTSFVLIVTIALGLLIIIVERPVDLPVAFQWLIETNFKHYSIDYSPVFPWIFIFVGGILSSKVFAGRSWFFPVCLTFLRSSIFVRMLVFIGQNSLILYLIHQPILIFAIYIFIYLT